MNYNDMGLLREARLEDGSGNEQRWQVCFFFALKSLLIVVILMFPKLIYYSHVFFTLWGL